MSLMTLTISFQWSGGDEDRLGWRVKGRRGRKAWECGQFFWKHLAYGDGETWVGSWRTLSWGDFLWNGLSLDVFICWWKNLRAGEWGDWDEKEKHGMSPGLVDSGRGRPTEELVEGYPFQRCCWSLWGSAIHSDVTELLHGTGNTSFQKTHILVKTIVMWGREGWRVRA